MEKHTIQAVNTDGAAVADLMTTARFLIESAEKFVEAGRPGVGELLGNLSIAVAGIAVQKSHGASEDLTVQ